MTSISLRAYHRQIEEWIDQGLYDRAILHCRHILNFYPKCVDTYRILGKAFLESQKFGDANDIFQRVLSSLPDDFVSHVGMSIVREDESNLNEAIWHMERAFEIQPSNNAIQGELRRLYGRRDGIEPTKVNLNRSALARMYLKGSLHSQAIAEIRMALAEDPQRPDLEVLLARAYFETQKISEAKEIANQLLAKLPYCYDAILLLWKISLLEGKDKDAERYLNKLAELDPYAAHLSNQIFSIELVPDTAVIVEKLEPAISSATQTISQPDWATSLGVQIPNEEELIDKSIPNWLTEQAPTPNQAMELKGEPLEELIFEPSETSIESTTSSEIPEWMREIGWEEGKLEESPLEEVSAVSPFSEEEKFEELATGEIPDWLKEISPVEEAEFPYSESTSTEETPFTEEIPTTDRDSLATWLAGLEIETAATEGISEPHTEELPEWVIDMNNKSHLTSELITSEETWNEIEIEPPLSERTPTMASKEPEILPPRFISDQEDLPSWLTEEEPISASEELPEWLFSNDTAPTSFQTEPAITEEDTKPVTIHPKAEITPEQSQSVEQPLPTMSEDEAFAWLESLAAKQGAQEALLLAPEERKEEPPEWIREYLDSQPDLAEPEIPVSDTADFSEIPHTPSLELIDQQPGSLEFTPPPSEEAQTEELPEWLRVALEKEGEPEATVFPEAEGEIPSWLSSIAEEEWIQEFPSELATETLTEETAELEPIASDTLYTPIEAIKVEESALAESDLAEISVAEFAIPEQEMVEPVLMEVKEESEPFEEVKSVSAEREEAPVSVEHGEILQPEISPLETARNALAKGLIDQALGQYQILVKQRLDLDQIIQDISNALYQYPMEVRMWMLLGDAYLRKDLLPEALDAYNKAEELLR